MSVVIKQARAIRALDINNFIKDAVISKSRGLLDINREQMSASRGVHGLLPVYSPLTRQYKARDSGYKGVWPHWNLYDTGRLQRTLSIEATKSSVSFIANVPYADDLARRIGADAFQLDTQSMEEARAIVTPVVLKDFHNAINA